jgi:hypothetical protein
VRHARQRILKLSRHHKTDMGQGQPILRSGDPGGVIQEMWALFTVYQAICRLTGIVVNAMGIPPGKDQLSARPGRRDGHRRGFPPDQQDLALAASLLKILMPGFFVHGRLGRASSRKTRKVGDFPAASPASPASPTSCGESSSTYSTHGKSPKSNPGPETLDGASRRSRAVRQADRGGITGGTTINVPPQGAGTHREPACVSDCGHEVGRWRCERWLKDVNQSDVFDVMPDRIREQLSMMVHVRRAIACQDVLRV